jgi:hypothetical protein
VLTAAKLLIEVNLVLKLRAQLVHDRNNRKRNASYKPVLPAATGTHRTRTNKERNLGNSGTLAVVSDYQPV